MTKHPLFPFEYELASLFGAPIYHNVRFLEDFGPAKMHDRFECLEINCTDGELVAFWRIDEADDLHEAMRVQFKCVAKGTIDG